MDKTYELLIKTLVDVIEYHFDIDDYDHIENLVDNIVHDREKIVTDCLNTVDGFFIEDLAEYAYRYLEIHEVTKEELLEVIRKPMRMFRYACYYAFDEAISKIIDEFTEMKEGV